MGDFGDAIDYIFNARESQAGGAKVGGSELLPLLWTHLEVTFLAMAIAIAIALPLGLWLGHTRRGAFATITISNVGRAVPSLALIAFFVAFFPARWELPGLVGTLWLDPWTAFPVGTTSANVGPTTISFPVENDPIAYGFALHFQAVDVRGRFGAPTSGVLQ